MKVAVTVVLDIDPDAWRREYGPAELKAIRDDVRWSAYNAVAQVTYPEAGADIIRSSELKGV